MLHWTLKAVVNNFFSGKNLLFCILCCNSYYHKLVLRCFVKIVLMYFNIMFLGNLFMFLVRYKIIYIHFNLKEK